jgi:3-hydroxyacyl-[acyl-carrier-protein] dehydratase
MSAMPDLLQLAMRSLPHGAEFRFVDRMVSLDPGKHGVGEYRVRGDEYYLRGHLPGEPILPGVLLVEAGAQVAGMVAQEDPANPSMPRLKLTALRAVKIFGSVRPGETLRIEAAITGRLGLLIQAKASASVSGVNIMSAELTLSATDSARPAAGARNWP